MNLAEEIRALAEAMLAKIESLKAENEGLRALLKEIYDTHLHWAVNDTATEDRIKEALK